MTERILLFFGAVYLLWNLFCFLVMGADKRKAIKQRRRVPEKQLILCAVFFGGLGSCAGMYVFRHKTQKKPFPWLFPLLCVVQLAVIMAFLLTYVKTYHTLG